MNPSKPFRILRVAAVLAALLAVLAGPASAGTGSVEWFLLGPRAIAVGSEEPTVVTAVTDGATAATIELLDARPSP